MLCGALPQAFSFCTRALVCDLRFFLIDLIYLIDSLMPCCCSGGDSVDEEEVPLKNIRDKIRQSLDVNCLQAAQAATATGRGGGGIPTTAAAGAAARNGGSILATAAVAGGPGGRVSAPLPPIPASVAPSRAGSATAGVGPTLLDLGAGNRNSSSNLQDGG